MSLKLKINPLAGQNLIINPFNISGQTWTEISGNPPLGGSSINSFLTI